MAGNVGRKAIIEDRNSANESRKPEALFPLTERRDHLRVNKPSGFFHAAAIRLHSS